MAGEQHILQGWLVSLTMFFKVHTPHICLHDEVYRAVCVKQNFSMLPCLSQLMQCHGCQQMCCPCQQGTSSDMAPQSVVLCRCR